MQPSRSSGSLSTAPLVALTLGLVTAAAFTGVIATSGQAQSNYDTNKADISFVSFCKIGSGSDAPSESTVSATFEQITRDGVTKDWQVSYELLDSPTIDYVLLKGGSQNSPNGYIVRIDDPTSPVTVFDGSEIGANFPDDFGPGNACLEGDTGVKFDN